MIASWSSSVTFIPWFHNCHCRPHLSPRPFASRQAGSGVDQVDESACSLLQCPPARIAGCFLNSLRAPVGTDICEDLCTVGQKFHEQHAKAVENVVLGSQDVRLTCAVPVKGSIQHCLCEVTVRIEVCPLSLSLETGCDVRCVRLSLPRIPPAGSCFRSSGL